MEILPLLIMIWVLGFFYFVSIWEYNSLWNYKIEKNAIVKENDEKITSKDIYIKLEQYGKKSHTVNNLTMYKDSKSNWYNFLFDFKSQILDTVTISGFAFSDLKGQLNMSITAPSETEILQTLRAIEKFKWLTDSEFNSISKEKISFVWDKKNYVWYKTSLVVYLDKEYLFNQYDEIRDYKDLKYKTGNSEGVEDITDMDLLEEWEDNNMDSKEDVVFEWYSQTDENIEFIEEEDILDINNY